MASTSSLRPVDESNVEKKFSGMKNNQENIQSLSLWALHHKSQHDRIVTIWFKVLKNAKVSHRLTMFYLANEIVQTCKRKHAVMYKDSFKEILREAAILVRDNSVRGNIERIFTIWGERGIYDGPFVEELINILSHAKPRSVVGAKVVTEFKPNKLRDIIGNFSRLEKEVDVKRRKLSALNLDVSSQNNLKLMKDRSHGKQYTQQVEDAHKALDGYVASLTIEAQDRVAMLTALDQGEQFYDAQYGEANIVANAYRNFGTRINNLRKKLDELRKTLPDPVSPIPSPTMDAPSPAASPPPQSTADNTEMMDMDMSDEDGGPGGGRAYCPEDAGMSPPEGFHSPEMSPGPCYSPLTSPPLRPQTDNNNEQSRAIHSNEIIGSDSKENFYSIGANSQHRSSAPSAEVSMTSHLTRPTPESTTSWNNNAATSGQMLFSGVPLSATTTTNSILNNSTSHIGSERPHRETGLPVDVTNLEVSVSLFSNIVLPSSLMRLLPSSHSALTQPEVTSSASEANIASFASGAISTSSASGASFLMSSLPFSGLHSRLASMTSVPVMSSVSAPVNTTEMFHENDDDLNDGSATPVQDENPVESCADDAAVQPISVNPVVPLNPNDLLNQLLNRSKTGAVGQASSIGSGFLQNLSALTQVVKAQVGLNKHSSAPPSKVQTSEKSGSNIDFKNSSNAAGYGVNSGGTLIVTIPSVVGEEFNKVGLASFLTSNSNALSQSSCNENSNLAAFQGYGVHPEISHTVGGIANGIFYPQPYTNVSFPISAASGGSLFQPTSIQRPVYEEFGLNTNPMISDPKKKKVPTATSGGNGLHSPAYPPPVMSGDALSYTPLAGGHYSGLDCAPNSLYQPPVIHSENLISRTRLNSVDSNQYVDQLVGSATPRSDSRSSTVPVSVENTYTVPLPMENYISGPDSVVQSNNRTQPDRQIVSPGTSDLQFHSSFGGPNCLLPPPLLAPFPSDQRFCNYGASFPPPQPRQPFFPTDQSFRGPRMMNNGPPPRLLGPATGLLRPPPTFSPPSFNPSPANFSDGSSEFMVDQFTTGRNHPDFVPPTAVIPSLLDMANNGLSSDHQGQSERQYPSARMSTGGVVGEEEDTFGGHASLDDDGYPEMNSEEGDDSYGETEGRFETFPDGRGGFNSYRGEFAKRVFNRHPNPRNSGPLFNSRFNNGPRWRQGHGTMVDFRPREGFGNLGRFPRSRGNSFFFPPRGPRGHRFAPRF